MTRVIQAGQTSSDDTVTGGILVNYGTAIGTFVDLGGTFSIEGGGTATSFIVEGGLPNHTATATAFAGAVARNGQINSGGDIDVYGTGIDLDINAAC